MKSTYVKLNETPKYRLIEKPHSGLTCPYKIQKKTWFGWITIHSDYYQETAEKNFDIIANHAGRKVIEQA